MGDRALREPRRSGGASGPAAPGVSGRNPLVLGIPRGAVPTANAIADALGGEFDVVVVQKLGAPFQPEWWGANEVSFGGGSAKDLLNNLHYRSFFD